MQLIKLRRYVSVEKGEVHTLVALRLNTRQIEENNIEELLRNFYDEPISIMKCAYVGDLNTYEDYKEVVKELNVSTKNRPAYRNYGVTIERQLKTLMFVNVCEDAKSSWNTVKCALGARSNTSECLGAIIAIIHKK